MGPLENDFDATIYTAEFVTAEVDEPVSGILEKVEAALERTPNVVLIIPRGSFAFHSTHDFLALGKLHGGREVRVAVASPDPTIASLARVLGFHIEDVPSDHPYMEHASTGGRPPIDTEQPTAPLPVPLPLPISSTREGPEWVLSQSGAKYPAPSITTSTWLNNPGDLAHTNAAHAPHLSPPLSRLGVPPPRTKPRQTGHLQLQPAIITDASLPSITSDRFTPAPPLVSTTPSGRIKARRVDDQAAAYVKLDERDGVRTWRRSTVRRVVAGVLVLLLLAAVGAGAYAYVYLPEGTVQVTPLYKELSPLQIQIPVLTTANPSGDGAQSGVAGTNLAQNSVSTRSLAASPLTATITEEDAAPATGSRTIAKGYGVGTLTFTNRTSYPVTVLKGALFKAANGVTVQITKGGVVPATIFGPGATVASVTLDIAATVQGPDGNISAGDIQGLNKEGTLSYINTAPLSGGTTQTFKVVTQKDIDDLVGKLKAKALDMPRATGLIVSQVAAGRQLITQTLQIAAPSVEVDRKANEDGDTVRAKVSTQVQAYAFKTAEMRDAVAQAMWEWVQANIPPAVGPLPDKSSLQFDTPTLASFDAAQGRMTYVTSATARVNFSLTPTLKNQILQLVTGKSIAEARSLITTQYRDYVNAGAIQAKVLGIELDKLPSDPARITIEGPGGSTLAPTSTDNANNVTQDDPSSRR